jgi:hypothetical protein
VTIDQDFEGRVERTRGCWPWCGYITPQGYGRYNRTIGGKRRAIQAHRLVYETEVGPIPEGMSLDHLCQNKWCVNPHHMEVVTRGENVSRGTENFEWKNRIAHWHETGRWESSAAAWFRRSRRDALT